MKTSKVSRKNFSLQESAVLGRSDCDWSAALSQWERREGHFARFNEKNHVNIRANRFCRTFSAESDVFKIFIEIFREKWGKWKVDVTLFAQ